MSEHYLFFLSFFMRHNTGVFMDFIYNIKKFSDKNNRCIIIFFCLMLVLCPISIYAKKAERVKKVKAENIAEEKIKNKTTSEALLNKASSWALSFTCPNTLTPGL